MTEYSYLKGVSLSTHLQLMLFDHPEYQNLLDKALKLESQSRPGFRYFKCECGHDWIEPCRDCLSPSGEPCPNCGANCGASPATVAQYDYFSRHTESYNYK